MNLRNIGKEQKLFNFLIKREVIGSKLNFQWLKKTFSPIPKRLQYKLENTMNMDNIDFSGSIYLSFSLSQPELLIAYRFRDENYFLQFWLFNFERFQKLLCELPVFRLKRNSSYLRLELVCREQENTYCLLGFDPLSCKYFISIIFNEHLTWGSLEFVFSGDFGSPITNHTLSCAIKNTVIYSTPSGISIMSYQCLPSGSEHCSSESLSEDGFYNKETAVPVLSGENEIIFTVDEKSHYFYSSIYVKSSEESNCRSVIAKCTSFSFEEYFLSFLGRKEPLFLQFYDYHFTILDVCFEEKIIVLSNIFFRETSRANAKKFIVTLFFEFSIYVEHSEPRMLSCFSFHDDDMRKRARDHLHLIARRLFKENFSSYRKVLVSSNLTLESGESLKEIIHPLYPLAVVL